MNKYRKPDYASVLYIYSNFIFILYNQRDTHTYTRAQLSVLLKIVYTLEKMYA